MGKYMEEAKEYQAGVKTIEGSLNETLDSLKKVDDSLGIDPDNCHDLLTYNVIISSAEIKDEINCLISDLDDYTARINDNAKAIDDRIERERLLKEKMLLAQEETDTSVESKQNLLIRNEIM